MRTGSMQKRRPGDKKQRTRKGSGSAIKETVCSAYPRQTHRIQSIHRGGGGTAGEKWLIEDGLTTIIDTRRPGQEQ